MSIALLVESSISESENAQTILFPHNNKINMYHRVSNGSKGKGQAWKPILDTNSLPTNLIKNEPVGVVMTERDLLSADLGQITNLTIKALYANQYAVPSSNPISHKDMVDNLINRLSVCDINLLDLVKDKRSKSGKAENIQLTPIVNSITEPMSMPEIEREEYTEPSVSVEQPVSNGSMNLITIPDPKWARQYVNRRINGVLDFDILDFALSKGINVKIEGEAGSGKTMCVQSYASARRVPYFNVSNNTSTEPSELFGQWIPKAEGGYKWQDGAVTQIVRRGGVLLLNEVNFLPVRVSTVLFSLLDYRREIQLMANGGEVVKAHPNLLIVADMNYGYRGTQEINQAFNDRFGIKLEFPYDERIETKIVKSKSLLALAKQLRTQYDKEEIATPVSTRALVAFVENANKFGMEFAITSFVNGFHKDERNPVKLACETHNANIANDLNISVASVYSDDSDYNKWVEPQVRNLEEVQING